MAISTKNFMLGAYFSLRAEMLVAEAPAERQAAAFYVPHEARPVAMAGRAPRPMPPQGGAARKYRSLKEMQQDEHYPDMYDIVLFPSKDFRKAHACEILGRFFGKTIDEASEIFNRAAEQQYSFVNERPYSLDVAETKLQEVKEYAGKRRIPLPKLELKKF